MELGIVNHALPVLAPIGAPDDAHPGLRAFGRSGEPVKR